MTTYEIIEKIEQQVGLELTVSANKYLIIQNIQQRGKFVLDKADIRQLIKELTALVKTLEN